MNELMNLISQLHHAVQHDKVDSAALDIVETLFLELSKEYGYDPALKDEMTQSFEKQSIKRLAQLEAKIKNVDQISFVQEQAKEMISKIRAFWKEAGFNYIQDISIHMSGVIEVKFGFSLGYGALSSINAVSNKEKCKTTKERLIEEGYVLDEKRKELIDCDINKEKIRELIENRFKSAIINSWESSMFDKGSQQKLQTLRIHIRDPLEVVNIAMK